MSGWGVLKCLKEALQMYEVVIEPLAGRLDDGM